MQGGPLQWGVVLGLGWLLALPAQGQPLPAPPEPIPTGPLITLEEIPPAYRDRCKSLLEKPTLRAQGPAEVFAAKAPTYIWLLDNPDKATTIWHMMGAPCADVTRRPDGAFGWTDGNGSDLRWDTLERSGTRRVWYAEGKVKVTMLLPAATVRALIVVHHHLEPGHDRAGRDRVFHRVDFALQTDSHLLGLASRLMGHNAPRMAEQFCTQIQTFFGGLAWYLDDDPERAAPLYRKVNGER
jgi:hypothetical protein